MAFNRDNLSRLSGGNSGAGVAWLYKSSDDTAATINTAGYFNDASVEFGTDDWLFIIDSAGAHVIAYVNSNTGGVVDTVDGTTVTATDTD